MPITPPELISVQQIYRGHVIEVRREKIRRADDPRTIDMDVVRHPGAAAVVALDEDMRVLLVRQWRQPLAQAFLELPAGCVDAGEEVEQAARRELREETGARAREWQSLATLRLSPGWSDETVGLFVARQLSFGAPEPDANEDIEVVRVPLVEAIEMVEQGALTDAKTACGLLLAQRRLVR